MQIPAMESENNVARRCLQHGTLRLDDPGPIQPPLIQGRRSGRAVGLSRILSDALRGPETLGATVPDVSLRRLHIPAWGSFHSDTEHCSHASVDAQRSVVAQEFLNYTLGLRVGTLAEIMEADSPFSIDEVVRRPIVVAERSPNAVVAIDSDQVRHVQSRDGIRIARSRRAALRQRRMARQFLPRRVVHRYRQRKLPEGAQKNSRTTGSGRRRDRSACTCPSIGDICGSRDRIGRIDVSLPLPFFFAPPSPALPRTISTSKSNPSSTPSPSWKPMQPTP